LSDNRRRNSVSAGAARGRCKNAIQGMCRSGTVNDDESARALSQRKFAKIQHYREFVRINACLPRGKNLRPNVI
jgi:hypothetical protein